MSLLPVFMNAQPFMRSLQHFPRRLKLRSIFNDVNILNTKTFAASHNRIGIMSIRNIFQHTSEVTGSAFQYLLKPFFSFFQQKALEISKKRRRYISITGFIHGTKFGNSPCLRKPETLLLPNVILMSIADNNSLFKTPF